MSADPEERVRQFVLKELIRDEGIDLGVQDPIFSSGLLDSFAVSQLICLLEDDFGVRIPATQVRIEDFDTIARCVAVVRRFQGSPGP